MPCNCNALGCAEMFGDRIARREAARFRRHGLEPRSRRLLEALAGRVPLPGKTAVEVGAGVGGLTISLLEKGVAHATIIDASPAYVETARAIATERGVAGALTAGIGNYAEDEAGEYADIVVMDRVVCCYPAWRGLLERATAQAAAAIALAYPRDTGYNRLGTALINILMRLRGSPFRVFVHPPRLMHAFLESRGFSAEVVGCTPVWELVVARRA
jgi:magnesium-protoporphyrin O-methyltransferase